MLFTILQLAIIARALLSWLPMNRYDNPLVGLLEQVTEPILAPLRRYIPPLGGTLDITPVVALILLQVVQTILFAALTGNR